MINKKILAGMSTAAIVTVLSTTLAPVAYAANRDIYDKANKKWYNYREMMTNKDKFNDLISKLDENPENFIYEFKGNGYNYKKLSDSVTDEKSFLESLKNEKLKEVLPSHDIKVESVSAITQTIASNKATELKFLVNGTEKLTAEEFEAKYKGYTVAFKYNVAEENKVQELGANHAKGEVTTKEADGLATFKYAVEVIDSEGNKLPKTLSSGDFVDVKVTNATTAVKVTEVQLQKEAHKWENSTITDTDAIKIVPSVYENDLGQKNTDKDAKGAQVAAIVAPTIETATSSAPTVAYYDKDKQVIKVLGTGEVTFTVKFKDIEGTHKVKVNALDEQKATNIKAEAQKIKADTATEKAEFVVLDQNGEAMRAETGVFYTLTKKGDAEVKDALEVKTGKEGKASLDVNKVVGEYIVNVYTTSDKKVKIGSFAVEAINVKADAKIDEYKIEFANEKVTNLDINPSKKVPSLEINVTPYVSGISVDVPAGVKVKSSDDTVFTAKFKDDRNNKVVEVKTPVQNAKAGKANIVLYTEEGDLKTELKTFEVEVKNTATQYKTLTLKPNTKVDGNATDLKKAVIAAVKEEVTEDQIADVKQLKDDGVVLVKMEDAFGGKTIQLDAEFVEAKLTGATLTPAVPGGAGQEAADAEAAKAKVGGVDFEAVTPGKEGNNIKVEITQGTATDGNPVQASVKYEKSKLTVTLGAEWNSSSKPLELKVSQLKTLINKDANAKAAIKVTTADDSVVNANVETSLKNGKDAVEHKDKIEKKDGSIVLTFSEAVALEENKQLKIGNDTFKNAKVSEDGKTVTAYVESDKQIKANDKVTVIEGIKPVKGKIIIPNDKDEIKVKEAN